MNLDKQEAQPNQEYRTRPHGLLIDLTGRTLGSLNVLSRDFMDTRRHTRWICQCECGAIKSIEGSRLHAGQTNCGRSCPIKKLLLREGRLIDLTGRTFGRLEVLSIDPTASSGRHMKWICRCECGAVKPIAGDHLQAGQTACSKECISRNLLAVQPDDPSYRIIPLTLGQFATVDTADYEALARFNWCARWSEGARTFYAGRHCSKSEGRGPISVLMHREILRPPADSVVDHKDHNGLHNRRENIRVATYCQNSTNRRTNANSVSGMKGVSINGHGRYVARIRVRGALHHLGGFVNPEDANQAYVSAAIEAFGEFSYFGK